MGGGAYQTADATQEQRSYQPVCTLQVWGQHYSTFCWLLCNKINVLVIILLYQPLWIEEIRGRTTTAPKECIQEAGEMSNNPLN